MNIASITTGVVGRAGCPVGEVGDRAAQEPSRRQTPAASSPRRDAVEPQRLARTRSLEPARQSYVQTPSIGEHEEAQNETSLSTRLAGLQARWSGGNRKSNESPGLVRGQKKLGCATIPRRLRHAPKARNSPTAKGCAYARHNGTGPKNQFFDSDEYVTHGFRISACTLLNERGFVSAFDRTATESREARQDRRHIRSVAVGRRA